MFDTTELAAAFYSGEFGQFTTAELTKLRLEAGAATFKELKQWVEEDKNDEGDQGYHLIEQVMDQVIFEIALARAKNEVTTPGMRTQAIARVDAGTPEQLAARAELVDRILGVQPPMFRTDFKDPEQQRRYDALRKQKTSELRGYLLSLTDQELELEAQLWKVEGLHADGQQGAAAAFVAEDPALARSSRQRPQGSETPGTREAEETALKSAAQRRYDEIQEQIDAAEDALEKSGVNPSKLYFPDQPVDLPGWHHMPADLAKLYAEREKVGAGMLQESLDAIVGRLERAGLSGKAIDIVLEKYSLGRGKTGGFAQGMRRTRRSWPGCRSCSSVRHRRSRWWCGWAYWISPRATCRIALTEQRSHASATRKNGNRRSRRRAPSFPITGQPERGSSLSASVKGRPMKARISRPNSAQAAARGNAPPAAEGRDGNCAVARDRRSENGGADRAGSKRRWAPGA
jgi:hypothetical protein